jgi:hypothetical protein
LRQFALDEPHLGVEAAVCGANPTTRPKATIRINSDCVTTIGGYQPTRDRGL